MVVNGGGVLAPSTPLVFASQQWPLNALLNSTSKNYSLLYDYWLLLFTQFNCFFGLRLGSFFFSVFLFFG